MHNISRDHAEVESLRALTYRYATVKEGRVDQGTASLFRVNERCLSMFPSAADVVMGRIPQSNPDPSACAPWQTDRTDDP